MIGRAGDVSTRDARGLPPARAEAEIYLALDHPHVARLEMVYETPEALHLVMEHMEGGELFERLRVRKRFTEDEAVETMRQILLAVAYLHAHRLRLG